MFYNLTVDELFHLFVPGYQDPIFKGISLGENATPSNLANNIYQFVSIKEAEEDSDHPICYGLAKNKEKKVIKKYKFKNAA